MTNKCKRTIAGIMAVATMAVSGIGMSASASYPASITLSTSSAKLYNLSGSKRYAVVSFRVYNRTSGNFVTSAGNNGTISNNGSVTASKSGYASTTTYYHEGSGTIYNGTNYQSGAYVTVSNHD